MATQLELSLMANRAYQSIPSRTSINISPKPDGWEEKMHETNPDSGFEAVYIKKGSEVVISFAGTYFKDLGGDWNANSVLGSGGVHQQLCRYSLYHSKSELHKIQTPGGI